MVPRLTPIAVLLALLACGNATGPNGAVRRLTAVNGATRPILRPGQVAGWTGFGFGAQQGGGIVRVTTAGGTAPAEVLEWSDDGIVARLPADAASGPTWVVTGRDSLGPIDLLVRPVGSFTPGVRSWTESAALPRPLGAPAAAAVHYPTGGELTGRVVLFGGRRADGALSDSTYLAVVDAGGQITSWVAAPDTVVPLRRTAHSMAGADRTNSRISVEAVAYLVGGVDTAGRVLADVRGISVTSAGAYGLWTSLTPLPGARAGAAAIVAFGNLIVAGGFGADSVASRTVALAVVNAEGTLNGWFEGPPLPEGRAFAAAAVVGETLFLVGGERGLIDPQGVRDTVELAGTLYAIRLSPRTGFFADSAWTELPVALLHPRARHAAFILDDALVLSGGVYAGMPSAGESEYASVDASGNVGTFQELPPPTVASLAAIPIWSAGAPRLLDRQALARATLLGGHTPGGVSARTWSQ